MIPYFDLKRQYENLKAELEPTLLEHASSGRYALGPTVESFEQNFAQFCGASIGVSVGSGTDALTFALKALGIGAGDEVIVPSFTFVASALAIVHAGATPVFAEIESDTYTLDPESVKKVLTPKTKALLPVHLYGHPANMSALLEIAKTHHLKVVEDACQAHGSQWQGKKSGSFGNAGCFSFYPTKNLGAFGDGGMVLTDDNEVATAVKRYRNLGRVLLADDPEHPGWTSRLDALQAAILNVKLKHLDSFSENRRRIAARYQKNLAATELILPQEKEGAKHVYHLYVVRVPGGRRDSLQATLKEKGIVTMVHYHTPVHKQAPFQDITPTCSLETTEKICQEILSLPMFPEMTDNEVDQVSEAIQNSLSAKV